jgi:hypothetical protein
MLTLCALLASLSFAADSDNSMSLDEVVKANTASVAGIQSLVVRVQASRSTPGESPDVLKPLNEYLYRKQGEAERMTYQLLNLPKNPNLEKNDRPGYSDASNRPSGFLEIDGYDPKSPAELGEYSLSRAYGILAPRKTEESPFRAKPKWDLLMTVFKAPDYYSLQDFVTAHPTAKLISTPANSPRRCYEIEVTWPEGWRRISIDPAANFMIRREESGLPGMSDQESSTVEVESFQDCGDGAFIPTRIVSKGQLGAGKTVKMLIECKVVSCNTPIPPEDLQAHFPDWLVVMDQKSGKVHYWGPDDKPRLTFDSLAEHRKWWIPRMNKAMAAKYNSSNSYRWAYLAGAIILVLAVFLVVRNQRQRRLAL